MLIANTAMGVAAVNHAMIVLSLNILKDVNIVPIVHCVVNVKIVKNVVNVATVHIVMVVIIKQVNSI